MAKLAEQRDVGYFTARPRDKGVDVEFFKSDPSDKTDDFVFDVRQLTVLSRVPAEP